MLFVLLVLLIELKDKLIKINNVWIYAMGVYIENLFFNLCSLFIHWEGQFGVDSLIFVCFLAISWLCGCVKIEKDKRRRKLVLNSVNAAKLVLWEHLTPIIVHRKLICKNFSNPLLISPDSTFLKSWPSVKILIPSQG